MPALKPGHTEFLLAWHPFTLTAGDRGSAIGAAAFDFIQSHLSLLQIRKSDDDHSLMKQGRMKSQYGAFLTTVLCTGRHEDGTDFSDQRP